MHFPPVIAALLGVFAMLISGCDLTTRMHYRPGTKLYERSSQRYYGEVLAYDSAHDFHNGISAQPAVEIELDPSESAQGQKERVWASCDVVSSGYDTK